MSSRDEAVVTQPGGRGDVLKTTDDEADPKEEYEPTGLKDLRKTSQVRIHQHLDVMEVLLCWERSNRYQVCDAQGQQIFYVYEVGDCFARKLQGASRALAMKMSDNDSQDIVSIIRPLRCTVRNCWWCCNLQEMSVHSPPGTPIATVREVWGCCQPEYRVYSVQEELLYSIVGDCCFCRALTDISFTVLSNTTPQEPVARLTKHWGGCREIIGASNDFSLTYLTEMDVKEKLTLFGSVFLVDFNYFERHCRC